MRAAPLAIAAFAALAAIPAPAGAQGLERGLIERCYRGDSTACASAIRLSVMQAAARAARDAPALSGGPLRGYARVWPSGYPASRR